MSETIGPTAELPDVSPGPVKGILNVAAYKFVPLKNLEGLRTELREKCFELGLRGTILLSLEGINLFLAGPGREIEEFRERRNQKGSKSR